MIEREGMMKRRGRRRVCEYFRQSRKRAFRIVVVVVVVAVVVQVDGIHTVTSPLRLGRGGILEGAPHHRREPGGSGDRHARSGVPSALEALQEGRLEDQMPGDDSDHIFEIE